MKIAVALKQMAVLDDGFELPPGWSRYRRGLPGMRAQRVGRVRARGGASDPRCQIRDAAGTVGAAGTGDVLTNTVGDAQADQALFDSPSQAPTAHCASGRTHWATPTCWRSRACSPRRSAAGHPTWCSVARNPRMPLTAPRNRARRRAGIAARRVGERLESDGEGSSWSASSRTAWRRCSRSICRRC